jgi:hypothetical protein
MGRGPLLLIPSVYRQHTANRQQARADTSKGIQALSIAEQGNSNQAKQTGNSSGTLGEQLAACVCSGSCLCECVFTAHVLLESLKQVTRRLLPLIASLLLLLLLLLLLYPLSACSPHAAAPDCLPGPVRPP